MHFCSEQCCSWSYITESDVWLSVSEYQTSHLPIFLIGDFHSFFSIHGESGRDGQSLLLSAILESKDEVAMVLLFSWFIFLDVSEDVKRSYYSVSLCVADKGCEIDEIQASIVGNIHLLKSAGSSHHRLSKLNSIVDIGTAKFSRFS